VISIARYWTANPGKTMPYIEIEETKEQCKNNLTKIGKGGIIVGVSIKKGCGIWKSG
jgi:hypothetical protein